MRLNLSVTYLLANRQQQRYSSPDATRNKSAFAYIVMSLPQDDRQLMDGFQKDKENGIWFSVDRCLLG